MPTGALHVLSVACVLLTAVCLSSAQTSCQQTSCLPGTYCDDVSGNAICTQCDNACSTCDAPGPERCLLCNIGYVKPQGVAQPCLSCGSGYFGVNCTSSCHCLNNDFCDRTDGLCSNWKCERGYTGIPRCQDICPIGTFGVDCENLCHCPVNDNCSIINGDCSSGQCHPEWGSSGCQRRLPRLVLPPRLVEVKCGNITLEWNAFNQSFDIGTGPVGQYRLYKALNQPASTNNHQWQSVDNITAEAEKTRFTYSVASGLVTNEAYTFRVDAVGAEFNKLMPQFSLGTESDIIVSVCAATDATPTETTRNIISRKVFDQINITAVNSTLIRVVWLVLPEVKVYQYNVTLTWQLLGNGDCDNAGDPVQGSRSFGISASPVALTGLLSWSTYRVSISAMALAADVRELYTQNVTTQPVIPVGVVTALKSDRVSSTEVELSWGPVPCSQRKGPLSSYEVIVTTAESPSTGQLKYITQNTRIGLANLTPYTKYTVQVLYTNAAGVGPPSLGLNFTTLEGVPGPVQISQLNPTYNAIIVRYQPPGQTNGILTSYTVIYNDSTSLDVYKSLTVPAVASTSGNLNITVQGLRPDTIYRLRMAASTSRGIGLYGTEQQTQTLSPEVLTIYLVSRTNSCLTIGWNIPPDLVGNITSFVLEVRRASADVTTPPNKVEIPVSQNSLQTCQLRSSTLYIVTLSGNSTGGLITLVNKDFSTVHGTPPTPAVPDFVRSNYTNITVTIEPVISPDVPVTAYQVQVFQVLTASRRRRLAGVPGYVTAELMPSEVTQRREFVVGDGAVYGSYSNKALLQNTYYMIYYVAVSTLNNDTTASWSQLRTNIRTVPFDSALAPPVTISLANKNMTCLWLTWNIPQELDNFLIGITVTIKRTSDGSSILSKDVPTSTRSQQQCDLTPYTLYTVDITAKTIDGRMTSSTEAFTTVHNTPRMPPVPVFVSSSYTSITVAIEPVVLIDAPLTAYQLQVESIAVSGRRKRVAEVPGYVTAQLSKENITAKMNFIVGDGFNYGGYVNKPLDRDTLYTIHYVVISTAGGVTKYSSSSLSPPVKTIPYFPPATSSSGEDNLGVLIGVVVGLALFILLIFLLIFLYWCWRRRNRFSPYKMQEDDFALPELKDNYNPEEYWSTSHDLKNSRYIVAGRDLVYKDRHSPPTKEEAALDPSLPRVSFHDEFHNLPHKSRKATDSQAQQNNQLNRFPHLLPYDHSLVKLKPDSSSQRTYINASFLPGYKRTPAYIAAQSPYDDDTVLDFWRLIYQKSIRTVVMITNVVEDSIIKCSQYWPDDTKASYGNFLLHLTGVTVYADYVVRTVEVRTKEEEISKTVQLFEFTSWPAHGVPDDPLPFVEMQHHVRCHHQDKPGPILVHCGTGMSRSGVFIAVDALAEQYAAEGRVMVFDFVRRMRKDRPYMVRTIKQYVFIYEALFEIFHAGNTLVDFDLKDKYHNWTQKNPRTGRTYLRDQHLLLGMFTRGPLKDEVRTALFEVNVHKNRYLDVLPPDRFRPLLSSMDWPTSTDYINALFLDGYLRKNQFIITQTPLATTITDFWRLVYDHDVRTIVMVENFKTEGVEYWSNDNPKQFEPFIIESTIAYQHDNITIRNFRLKSSQHPKVPARLVMQFQFNAWAQANSTPQSKTMMMDLIDDVFAWQDKVCQNKKPVIVHCQDGSFYSGLFAVLAILCEKMKKDKKVDIFKTIKHCKRRRTQLISDYDQLRFCYKTVWDYINLRMPGGLLTDTLGQNKNDQLYGMAPSSLKSYVDLINGSYTTEI